MKKIISLTIAVCLLCAVLTGCKTEVVEIDDDKETVLEAQLVVWLVGIPNGRFDAAQNLFEGNYPNISFEIVEKHTDTKERTKEAFQAIGEEIESGAKCDVIIAASEFFQYCDMYKLQKNGAFMDLTSIMDADKNSNIDGYNTTIINGAAYNGEQYIIPITYTIPMFYSTAQNMEQAGLDPSSFTNSTELLNGFEQYYEGYGANTGATLFQYPDRYKYAHKFMGLGAIDHKAETVNLNSAEYKKSMEFWKTAYTNETKNTDNTRLYNTVDCVSALENNKSISIFDFSGFDLHFTTIKGIMQEGKDCVYFPWRDTSGGIQAEIRSAAMVSSESKNQEVAWTFIKNLLNMQTQFKLSTDHFGWWGTGIGAASYMGGFPLYQQDWRERATVGEFTWERYNRIFENCEDNWAEKYKNDFAIYNFNKFIPSSELEGYNELHYGISGVFMRTPADDLLYTSMQKYFLSGKDYDECVKEAEEAMAEYWS